MSVSATDVQKAYLAYFGRPADPVGLTYWQSQDKATMHAGFADSTEYGSLYSGMSETQRVSQVYTNLLGRDADATGLVYWAGELAAGRETVSSLVVSMMDNALGDDVTTIANRVTYAEKFSAALDTSAEITGYSGDSAAAATRTAIASVTDDASLATAEAALDTSVSTVTETGTTSSGETFTLTDSTDSVTGTSGNDKIIAGTDATNNTLNAGDTIDGKGGTDKITLFGDGNIAGYAGADISNVEHFFMRFDAATAGQSIDLTANTDVTQAWAEKGTTNGANTITINKAQTAGIKGEFSANTAGADTLNFAFDDASAASGDEANLSLDSADTDVLTAATGGVVIDAIETLNISATGTNSLGGLDTDSVTKLVITGAGKLTTSLEAGAAAASYKTIDASDNTGGVTLDITDISGAGGGAAQDFTITGGTGNDKITTVWAELTKDDTIDLGDGTDALIFNDAVTISTSTQAGVLANVSNVEEFGVNSAAGVALTLDADLISSDVNTFSLGGAGDSAAITDAAEGVTLNIEDVAIAASNIATKLGASEVNIGLEGGKTTAADATAGVTVTGESTINVASSGTAGVTANDLLLNADDNTKVVVTGSQNLLLDVENNGGNTGNTVDGSDFTGDLSVFGNAEEDAIIGGSGDDYFEGGTPAAALTPALTTAGASGTDTFTGNGGKDTFGIAANSVDQANMVTITDFAAGDKLSFGVTAGSGSFVSSAIDVTSASSLGAALDIADTATTNNISWFVYDSNTYVLAEGAATDDNQAADSIVKLTGTLDLSDSTLSTAATGDVLTFA